VAGPFADFALAKRLESLVAAEMRRFAETAAVVHPGSGATFADIAGGVATFTGSESPVNQAAGLGFAGPVLNADIERLERFYLELGVRPLVQVCPLAHPSLLLTLAERGWSADGFENLLVRPIDAPVAFPELPDGVEIRECSSDDEREVWALVAANGFSAPFDPTVEQTWISRIVIARPGSRLYLAYVDGRPAATGELMVEGGVGWLSADTTLPQFQGRGLQRALQDWRLAVSVAEGCELAATESAPGSVSQRNQQRAGFWIAYTRVDLALSAPLTR
jgi:hypothetical protein